MILYLQTFLLSSTFICRKKRSFLRANHRMVEVEGTSRDHLVQSPWLEQGYPEQVTQDHIQMDFIFIVRSMWAGPKQFGPITSILLCISLTRILSLSSEQKCARSFSGISRAAKRTACEVHQRARCPSRENCFPQHVGLLWSPIKSGNRGTQPEREGKWHPTSPFIYKLQKYSRKK